MSLAPELLAVLACPESKAPLLYFAGGEDGKKPEEAFLLCPTSRLRYRIAGGRLVFTQPNLKVLTSCRLDTLACEPLPGLAMGDFDHDYWAVGPRSIFLRVFNNDGKPRLARYDLESRKLTQSWDLAPNANGASIAIAPDESRVAIVREEPPAIDLMIAR
jgi:uncharacterized protein YbaR (Trm112 family)